MKVRDFNQATKWRHQINNNWNAELLRERLQWKSRSKLWKNRWSEELPLLLFIFKGIGESRCSIYNGKRGFLWMGNLIGLANEKHAQI